MIELLPIPRAIAVRGGVFVLPRDGVVAGAAVCSRIVQTLERAMGGPLVERR